MLARHARKYSAECQLTMMIDSCGCVSIAYFYPELQRRTCFTLPPDALSRSQSPENCGSLPPLAPAGVTAGAGTWESTAPLSPGAPPPENRHSIAPISESSLEEGS